MQAFDTLTAAMKLQDSVAPITNRDTTLLSNSSGTSFPTTSLVLGMQCWRTDLGRMYVLVDLTPTWDTLLRTGDTDARYLGLTGGTVAGDITLNATGAEHRIYFSTTATTGRRSWLFAKPSDETVGLYSERNARPVWTYTPSTDRLDLGILSGGIYTNGSNAVWHAGNDGASSGLDADLLDGQHGSYYSAWANITGKPSFTDAATTTVATIQAGVNLASRVLKTGDTMSGSLAISVGAIYAPVHAMQDYPTSYMRSYSTDGSISLYTANNISQVFSTGGRMWTANWGWLDDHFGQRATVEGVGVYRLTGNCGNIPSASGYEVYDTGDGRHQIRYFAVNCSNCATSNCACDCGNSNCSN